MSIKTDRDRFVAFAFAAADAFVEVDRSGTIIYANGALDWLAGGLAPELVGHDISDYLDRKSRSLLEAAIENITRAGRLGPIPLRFQDGNGHDKLVEALGTALPNHPDRLFLAFRSPSKVRQHLPASKRSTDQVTGLIKPEDFKHVTAALARSAQEEDDKIGLSLFEIDGLDKKLKQMDDQGAAMFLERVIAQLSAISLDGKTTAQLSGQGFGVVHEDGLDVDGVARAIEALDDDASLKVQAETVDLSGADLSEEDLVKALVYTVQEFWNDPGGFKVKNIADGYERMLADTKARMATFRKVVSDRQFDALLQPVVSLDSRRIHHYEALARIKTKDADASPFEFITFAEDAGVVGDFDIAMCHKVIDRINQAANVGKELAIAVNVSGRSLMSDQFVDELTKLLKKNKGLGDNLLFEVTESTQIQDLDAVGKVLSDLRKLGHPVCLDDFGAGAAGYQYLRALEVDFVKIDGVYIRESSSTEDGRTLLRSMAELCRELKLSTIGEFVETSTQARFLRDIGVTHGQGYFFGKPSTGIKDSDKIPPF